MKKKVLNAVAINAFKNRKNRNADIFYNYKIIAKAFDYLKLNLNKQKKINNLNTKMMYFLKKKCISYFKVAFT